MRQKTNHVLFALMLVVVVAACACRDAQKPNTANTSQAGQCPKVEGSYFGADKSEIVKGEAIRLSWKVPTAYQESVRIEGLEPQSASSIKWSYDDKAAPGFMEGSFEGVTLEKTTRFILKASGPQGCQPLELPATVKVIGNDKEQQR